MFSKQKKILIALLSIVLLVGISGAITKFVVREPESLDDTNFALVSVGDILGVMKVVSAVPFNSGQYSTDPKMMKIGPENIKIILRGHIEVTGTYSAVHSEIGFDGYCMSVSDVASLSRLPILPGIATKRSYFCFRNTDFARQKLGEESRTIIVNIDNYELNSYPAEVMDWAELISVVKG